MEHPKKKTMRINRVPWKEIPSISRAECNIQMWNNYLFEVQYPRDLATVNLWPFILVDILTALLFARYIFCELPLLLFTVLFDS